MSHARQSFSIAEIFEIAQQMERNGARFYRAASDVVVDKQQRELLVGLAVMEEGHEKTFNELEASCVSDRSRQSVYEADDLPSQYLWAWANKAVFDLDTDPLEGLSAGTSLSEILRVAISREKDSIVFYEGLKAGLSSADDRARVDLIIQEEMLHMGQLSAMLIEATG